MAKVKGSLTISDGATAATIVLDDYWYDTTWKRKLRRLRKQIKAAYKAAE